MKAQTILGAVYFRRCSKFPPPASIQAFKRFLKELTMFENQNPDLAEHKKWCRKFWERAIVFAACVACCCLKRRMNVEHLACKDWFAIFWRGHAVRFGGVVPERLLF
jgi:hypothetical protein